MCSTPSYDSGLSFGVGGGGGGTGTVTSVAMSVPSFLSVSGSPITTAGTLAVTLATQSPNLVFIGPTTGGAATPTFRQIVAPDLNPTFSNGQVLSTDGSGNLSWITVSGGGGGTVTSVGLSAPSIFTVSGSPVTVSGTLSFSLNTVTANNVFIGAIAGSAVPTFRYLKAEDLSAGYLNGYILTTNGSGTMTWLSATLAGLVTSVGLSAPSIFTVSGSPVTTTGTLTLTLAVQTANRVFVGPASGGLAAPTFRQLEARDMNTTFSNGQVLSTNGSGVLAWVTPSGTPGGANTNIQYNNTGGFGGSANFAYDYTNSVVTLVRPNIGLAGGTFTITNNNISGASSSSFRVNHNDTYLGSVGAWIEGPGTATAATGLLVTGWGNSTGSNIFVASLGDRRSLFTERDGGGITSIYPIVEVNQFDTTASFVFSASYYTGSTYNSILGVWGSASDSGAARGTVGFRMNSAPTNGVIEMPWISGDNKPILHVGGATAASTALVVRTGPSASYTMQAYALGVAAFNVKASGIVQVLTGNATGQMLSVGGLLYGTPTTVVFSAGGNVPYSTTLNALTLQVANDAMRQTFALSFANNSNAKDISVVFGSATLFTYATTSTGNGEMYIEIYTIAVSYISQQHVIKVTVDDGTTTVTKVYYAATTENFLSSVNVVMTGNCTAGADITFHFGAMEILSHPE